VLEGKRLFINATAAGELRAEIIGPDGRAALPGWSASQCVPVKGDQVRAELTWSGKNLAELAGQRVRVRFHLKNADLYSFWLEP
jgi:hypothetical protein